MIFNELNADNFLLFAIKHYENPQSVTREDFEEDMKRFKYLKRLFRRYTLTSEIKVRLIVNHIVVLQNVFGVEAACVLLLYKIDEQYWPILKTVLIHLDYLYPHELNNVQVDENIKKLLEEM